MEEKEIKMITSWIISPDFLLFNLDYNYKDYQFRIDEATLSMRLQVYTTIKKYGGDYANFEELVEAIDNIRWRLHEAARGLLEFGKEFVINRLTEEMIKYIRNAIFSYTELFPEDPIYQQVLDEYNWN